MAYGSYYPTTALRQTDTAYAVFAIINSIGVLSIISPFYLLKSTNMATNKEIRNNLSNADFLLMLNRFKAYQNRLDSERLMRLEIGQAEVKKNYETIDTLVQLVKGIHSEGKTVLEVCQQFNTKITPLKKLRNLFDNHQ